MSVDRLKRVNELLRREIGEAIFRVMTEEGFDLSAVTVTHVECTRNLREARVQISIRDHEDDRGRMMALLRKHRGQIQSLINRDLVLKYTPRLNFELDLSVERGDQMLHILSEIEDELAAREPPEGPDPRPDIEANDTQ